MKGFHKDTNNHATTLVQHLLSTHRRLHVLEGAESSNASAEKDGVDDLIMLLASIAVAVKSVGSAVRRRDITHGSGTESEPLERVANETWIDCLLYSQRSCILVSEDLENPVVVESNMQGKFAVVFDPLTGRSNPPCQEMGAIFGVFRQMSGGSPVIEDVMQPGRQMVAAGYALYGACTVLFLSLGSGVHGFTLDPALNEFILTHENIRIPYCGHIYSVNEGYSSLWQPEIRELISRFKTEVSLNGKERTLRYIGSMVADVHRTLLNGGIFMYFAHQQWPNGKLKLLYEASPLAFIIEQAGGKASTGLERILDITPTSVHDRIQVVIGSYEDVELVEQLYKGPSTSDPMYLLRRSHSIEEMKDSKEESNVFHKEEDGPTILCSTLPRIA
ncbi:hypothetical protein GAYE_SCF00G1866 [Galdieria yellowstonensis]|uniref:fructose-bisphosphatase n=1 Tax=Galdieria yellowstonensis TaxID=3028027 RepID=A0AAV9I9D7_9RHOD|nr:hypothetical protein GAYE_SCF00G1866 [Galdieria yellowstonensis]